MGNLSPVRGYSSLQEQAYQAIKEGILSLQLKPGAALVESELARQLGISKTPIRDALLQLEKEGLVVKILFKGTYVAEISEGDIHEIFEIRARLEGLAARRAAEFFSPEDVEKAQALLNEQEKTFLAGDLERSSECNRLFHQMLYNNEGCKLLIAILGKLEDQLVRFRRISSYQTGRLHKSVGEHRLVLEAIERKDGAQAEQRMQTHLYSVMDDLILIVPEDLKGGGSNQ